MKFRTATFALMIGAALLGGRWATADTADTPPTVVELFTSQGCSSCPPADAYLGELAKRSDIIALSLHVDYWDYIGWKDPFALPINSARQRVYASNMGIGYVYTPQMVVQGMAHATGSNRQTIENLITGLKGAKRLAVTASASGNRLQVSVSAGDFAGETATVYLAAFDAKHDTEIKRGENGGHTLNYYNVVRDMADIGTWNGARLSLDLPDGAAVLGEHDGGVILVQSTANGRILGAARVAAKPAG